MKRGDLNLKNVSEEKLKKAIKALLVFKDKCKKAKEEVFDVYLIYSEFFEKRPNQFEVNANIEDIVDGIKDSNLKEIKILQNLEDIEDYIEYIEIIDDNFIQNLGFNIKDYEDKKIKYLIKSNKEQQIIFKNGSKLNIKINDEKEKEKDYNIIEAPFIQGTNNTEILNLNCKKSREEDKKNNDRNNLIDCDNNSNDSNNENEKKNLIDSINDNKKDKNSYCLFECNSIVKQGENNNELINFYKNIKECFIQQDKINKLIKGTIDTENENNYLIFNKKWFHKLITIFENNDIYENENEKISSFDQLTNIENNNNQNMNIFNERKKKLEDEKLFKIKFSEILDKKYPDDFILMDINLIMNFNLNFNVDINENIYKIIFGDNYVFIRDNKDNKNIFVCSRDNFYFTVNAIFIFQREHYYKNELIKYIKNTGGIQRYIKIREFDINETGLQRNISMEGDVIGEVLFINYKEKHDPNITIFISILFKL